MSGSEHGSSAKGGYLNNRRKMNRNNILSVEFLANYVIKINKKLNSSKKMDGVKKQRDILIEKLDQLGLGLQKRETMKFEKIPRFQEILKDLEKELPYIEKHIERMDKSNAIKRAFIKNNVNKKFKEISERIANISRTINVFEVNERIDVTSMEREIKDVQLQMDKLADNIKENNEKRDLDKALRQPSRPMRDKPYASESERKSSSSSMKVVGAAAPSQNSKSEQLLLDAHWYFNGEGIKKDVEKAVDLYEESARLGNADAWMALANFYESNLVDQVNHDMAAYYYKIAAELKKPYALYKTGYYIEKGTLQLNTDEQAKTEIFKNYKAAMNLGNAEATIRLAQIYEKGELDVIMDKNKALELYEEVSYDDKALNAIGSLLYERAQFKRASEYFRKASEKGNIESLNNLGIWYELGKGVHKDVNRAYELYKDAAERENAQAMSNLGYLMYKKGKVSHSSKHFVQAAHWFRKSITEDYTIKDSHYYLGVMYQNGEGVDKWYKSAFKCYKIASDFSHDIAWEKLGDLCYSGYGCVRPDKTKAFQWYTIGADLGNTQCLNSMGIMIEQGFDAFTPDPVRAAEFYQKAHENKNTDATFNLGLLFMNSIEFDTTNEEALKLIHKAAMNGNTRAQDHLINLGYINNKLEFMKNEESQDLYLSEDELEEEESEEEGKLFSLNI